MTTTTGSTMLDNAVHLSLLARWIQYVSIGILSTIARLDHATQSSAHAHAIHSHQLHYSRGMQASTKILFQLLKETVNALVHSARPASIGRPVRLKPLRLVFRRPIYLVMDILCLALPMMTMMFVMLLLLLLLLTVIVIRIAAGWLLLLRVGSGSEVICILRL